MSKGPELKVMPNVVGMTFEEAEFIQQTTVYNTESPKVSPRLEEEDDYYEQELRYRKEEADRRKARNRRILIASVCTVAALLLVACIVGAMFIVNSNKDDGKILNNVTVAGVNIGGMTPEEATEQMTNEIAGMIKAG